MVREELQATAGLAHLDLSEDEGAFGVPVLDLPPTTQAFSAGNRLRFDATANNSNNTNSNPLYNLANELLNRSPESENRFVVIPNVL